MCGTGIPHTVCCCCGVVMTSRMTFWRTRWLVVSPGAPSSTPTVAFHSAPVRAVVRRRLAKCLRSTLEVTGHGWRWVLTKSEGKRQEATRSRKKPQEAKRGQGVQGFHATWIDMAYLTWSSWPGLAICQLETEAVGCCLGAFLTFEFCVGWYFPCVGILKSEPCFEAADWTDAFFKVCSVCVLSEESRSETIEHVVVSVSNFYRHQETVQVLKDKSAFQPSHCFPCSECSNPNFDK